MVADFQRYRTLFSLLSLWILIICLINPIFEFPLNDDWSYAYAVKTMAVEGDLEYRGWMSMSLISQVLWGTVFVKIFGFSFTILRISTLILSFLGLVFTYKIFEFFGLKERLSLIMTIFLGLSPVYLNLSFTFMTDVPFYTYLMIALYFSLKYLKQKRLSDFILGFIFSLLAIFTRQLGLVIPLIMLLYGIRDKDVKLIVQFAVCFGLYVWYMVALPTFIEDTGRIYEPTQILINGIKTMPLKMITDGLKRVVICFIYAGIFLSPFVLLLKWKKWEWAYIIPGGVLTFLLYRADFLMPMNGNIIYDFGVGPKTLYDTWIAKTTSTAVLSLGIKILLTFSGVVFGLKLGMELILQVSSIYKIRQKDRAGMTVFLVLLILLVVSCSVTNFDRYYIPIFFLLLLMIGNDFNRIPALQVRILGGALGAIILFYSLLGNIDYFNWQKARWEGINYLLQEKGVPTDKIDGGFEYNGWYNYNPGDFYDEHVENLWVPDDAYKICFENIEGYHIIKEVEYKEWLKWGRKRTIKVLERDKNE